MNVEQIAHNVYAAAMADQVVDLAEPQALKAPQRFWERLRELADQHLPRPAAAVRPELVQMTNVQAKAFGASVLSFGKHQGRRVDEVPLDYLEWLAGQENEFQKNLRRYLLSERIVREAD